jgi:hypothetical protein
VLDKLNFSIESLRNQGAGQIADAQSFGFAVALGIKQDAVRVGLSILLALVVKSVCCFGLLVVSGGHPHPGGAIEMTVPEWFGKWLADRSEPHPSAPVSFSALEADFRSWAEGRSAPKMSSHKFANLIHAACEEVGLSVEGQIVVGLRGTLL